MTALDSARTTRSLPRLANRRDDPRPGDGRPRVDGKFLAVGDRRLWLRGVTYGTFAPGRPRRSLPGTPRRSPRTSRRWRRPASTPCASTPCRRAGCSTCAEHGLWVLVGLPWEQHVAFLDERRRARAIVASASRASARCAGHPAVLGYAVGNEIPASIVRWHGRRRVERFLDAAVRARCSEDRPGRARHLRQLPEHGVPAARRSSTSSRSTSTSRTRRRSTPTSPGSRASPGERPLLHRRDRARQPPQRRRTPGARARAADSRTAFARRLRRRVRVRLDGRVAPRRRRRARLGLRASPTATAARSRRSRRSRAAFAAAPVAGAGRDAPRRLRRRLHPQRRRDAARVPATAFARLDYPDLRGDRRRRRLDRRHRRDRPPRAARA